MTDRAPRTTLAFAFAFVALYALHLALLGHFFPWALASGEVAISGMGDFATHMNQTTRVVEGLTQWGHGWVYDPRLIAGHPAGTIFDADNKAWEVFAFFGTKLGWSVGTGHTRFVVLAHLAMPFVVYASARLFDLERSASLVAMGLGIGLWYFDSFAHWCWWAGMVAYDMGAYSFLLPLALFYRFLQRPGPSWALLGGLALGLAHLIHPYVFFMLAVPMLAMFWRAWPQLSKPHRGWVFAIAGITLLINGWWLHNAASFWHYILDSAYYGQSGLSFLAADYASLLINAETTGLLGTRTGFRFLAWALGAIAIWRWHKQGDARALPFGLGMGTMLLLTYFGGYLHATQQVQPYRFALPSAYLACLGAGHFAIEAGRALKEQSPKGPIAFLVLALSVTAGQHLVRDATFFMPDLLPKVSKTFDGLKSPIGADGYITPKTFRYGLMRPDEALLDYVREHDDGQSRWLVEVPFLGEEIAWQTDAQVLGGFTHRNVEHSWANFFRRRPQGVATPDELRAYFETYAVGWVVVTSPGHWLWRVPNPTLELVATVGISKIFRTKIRPSLVARGGGTAHASTNLIEVRGSDPKALVRLRFHWMETLRCRPDCTLERAEVDGVDPVGFVEVPAPHPADFEIYNAYDFGDDR